MLHNMESKEESDYEEVTYTGLQIFKSMGFKIICKGEDITNKIEELKS